MKMDRKNFFIPAPKDIFYLFTIEYLKDTVGKDRVTK